MENSNFNEETRAARLRRWLGTDETLETPTCTVHSSSQILDDIHSPQNISMYGFFLGCWFTIGLGILCFTSFWHLGGYILCLSVFHHLEYLLTALYKPENLQLDSYLLSHSTAYMAAIFSGIFEYLIEKILFPAFKGSALVCTTGVLLIVVGQVIRTLAMHTAKSNFNHQIVDHKSREHTLVTWGIYRFLRHPSYFGFYVWAVGMQLLLSNPISLGLYLYALNRFFAGRIVYEERTLNRFFGQRYKVYCENTWTWLPLIYPSSSQSTE
ncbi:farnesyl cysteine-carboxyl methyltransferase [Basidiobolus ranarum]|uniref:Protein-S-isoprenylcysteine O-methyltransferase n=1 Tax=Basidiobolus ranarum TaxID=34480 RepID=A0ABR2WKF0_9FUNG